MELSQELKELEALVETLAFHSAIAIAEQQANIAVLIDAVQRLAGPERCDQMQLLFADKLEVLTSKILNDPPASVPVTTVASLFFDLHERLRILRGGL